MKDIDKGLIRGVCLAVAELTRTDVCSVIAEEILDGAGITVKVMKETEVDDYDFKVIENLFKTDFGRKVSP